MDGSYFGQRYLLRQQLPTLFTGVSSRLHSSGLLDLESDYIY